MAIAYCFSFTCVRNLLCNSYRNLPARISSIHSISHTTSNDNSHGEIDDIPPPPKRPVNSYMRFYKDIYPFVRNNMPGMKIPEIAKHVAKEWRNIGTQQKKKYEVSYKQEMEEYATEYAKWRKTLTEDQITFLQETKKERRQLNVKKKRASAKREFHKSLEQLGKPKKPMNSFLLFCHETRPEHVKNSKLTIKTAAEQWKKMSIIEKLPYNERAGNLLEDYKKNLLEWEKKMVQQGKKDLLKMDAPLIKRNTKSKSTNDIAEEKIP